MRLGAARKQARTAWRLLVIEVAADGAAFSYRLDREKLRRARRREGRYLLRTNLSDDDPARLWALYLQLVSVEEAFRNLKSLPLRRQGAISPFGRSFTRTRRASRRASSSPSLPTACMSPSAVASMHWPRPHTAQRHRQVRRHADDRSACPHHRRPRVGVDPLHRA